MTEATAALFALASWEPDPVAVLYSHQSVEVEWLLNAAGEQARGGDASGVKTARALAAWAEILADIGIAPRYVDAEELARGSLRRGGARVLILPRACVLGCGEVAEIARFARGGGLVVADAWAGLLDETFAPAAATDLPRLFGVKHRWPTEYAGGKAVLEGVTLPGAYIDGVRADGLTFAEEGLTTSTGFALARLEGTRGLVTGRYGRGRGVYLNLALEHYAEARTRADGADLRRLVANCLELGGVEPRAGLVAGGRPVPACERLFWRLGETELVAVRRDGAFGAEPVRNAELVLGRPAYCYDLIDGVFLGAGSRVRLDLVPGVRIFARLPYDVESIRFAVQERAGTGPGGSRRTEVRFRAIVETSTGLAGTHVLYQEVLDSEGRPIPGTGGCLVARRGVATGTVALAENEPAGAYRLVVRDVATGTVGELTIVRPESPLQGRFPLAPDVRGAR